MIQLINNVIKKKQYLEYLTLLLLLLFVYKNILPSHYNNILKMISTKINNYDFIIEILFYSLFFLSIIIYIIYIILVIINKPINCIYSRKFISDKDNAIMFIKSYYNFLYGSQTKLIIIFQWLIVIAGYLYLLKPQVIREFITNSITIYDNLSQNIFLQIIIPFFGIFYFLFLIYSIIKLIQSLAYVFLYLKVDLDKK